MQKYSNYLFFLEEKMVNLNVLTIEKLRVLNSYLPIKYWWLKKIKEQLNIKI